MRRYFNILTLGAASLILLGCNVLNVFDFLPTWHTCWAVTLQVTDATSDAPIVGALVEWAPANESDLTGHSADEHLDEFGEIIGITSEHGIIAYPLCGVSDPISFVESELVPDYEVVLLRIHIGSESHTLYPYTPPDFFANDAIRVRWGATVKSWRSWEDLVREVNEFP
jgi:hypothetical protein